MESLKIILVMVTVDSKENADKISRHVFEKRLAACVQVEGPIESRYYWKNELLCSQEYRMQFKTRASLYTLLEKEIVQLHPYEIPEICSIELRDVLKAYSDWVIQETREAQ